MSFGRSCSEWARYTERVRVQFWFFSQRHNIEVNIGITIRRIFSAAPSGDLKLMVKYASVLRNNLWTSLRC